VRPDLRGAPAEGPREGDRPRQSLRRRAHGPAGQVLTDDAPPPDGDSPFAPRRDGTERLDKWLWQARFFKTRSLAARLVSEGKIRVNAQRVSKPARAVGPGDTLTFPQGRAIRVVRITALPVRRGPAPEAQACYDDLSPPEEAHPGAPEGAGQGPAGGGARRGPRPTKKDRRNLPDF
jgi:ribosome-associated heat shock protein Hsp15